MEASTTRWPGSWRATAMVAPANGFYSTSGLGQDEVRIAYVLNVEDIKKAMHILGAGLKVYPGKK